MVINPYPNDVKNRTIMLMLTFFYRLGIFTLLFFMAAGFLSGFAAAQDLSPLPDDSQQLILVIAGHQDEWHGRMLTFERDQKDNSWLPLMTNQAVTIGKKGLAWGSGLHSVSENKLQKREGDGKSPAGAFDLVTLYGFAARAQLDSLNLKMPYVTVDSMTECVDDSRSAYYNQIVSADTVSDTDWNSSEEMLRVGSRYEFGIVVRHNDEAEAGAGSCIFFHIWGGPEDPTIGCTAMSRTVLLKLFRWLDAAKRPVVVQLTRDWYLEKKDDWSLPTIKIETEQPLSP